MMPEHLTKPLSSTKSPRFSDKPGYLLIFVVSAIFVSEFMVMIVLKFLPPLTPYLQALLDATLLSIIVFPAMYFLFFKPLITHIAVRKHAEEEKIILITELSQAMDEVKTLQGIIPICSYCKKIRDDKGQWNQLEEYIHSHSSAEFSHGICPECYKKQMEEELE